MEAFSAYREKRYSDAADLFRREATKSCSAGPDLASILANVAASELKMELNRRCLKTCDEALAMDPSCLRAYLYKGRALVALGKGSKAAAAWRAGLEAKCLPSADVETQSLLARELSGETMGPAAVVRESSTVPAAVPSSLPTPAAAIPDLAEKQTLRLEALAAPVAAAAAAAAERVARELGMDAQGLHVTEPMLAAARGVLSHSCGTSGHHL